MTEKLEVALETLNGNPFEGTITFLEAKHRIFRWCCGFADIENFDKVRFGYNGDPVAIFKLKNATNVDDLLPYQSFVLKRKIIR